VRPHDWKYVPPTSPFNSTSPFNENQWKCVGCGLFIIAVSPSSLETLPPFEDGRTASLDCDEEMVADILGQ
jgi:hypothetical protein